VLHHAEDPDRVLNEAARVCRRLVVLESVVENSLERGMLTVLDYLANLMRGMSPEKLSFDSQAGWYSRFESAGLYVDKLEILGDLIHRRVLFHLVRKKESA
jgi:ubiquinone/menaquinone biosynthesis C-methylase UbiE